MASRRTLSARRFHRDEHEPSGRARCCLLQQARNMRAVDQGRQRRDQMDALVVPDVRRQRGATSAPCARLQSRQFPAHAGDAGADQRLVADEPEGQADQDRREGREPRPLRRLPDGRGRHPTANVRGYLAIDRRTTAAATTSASVRRSMVMHSAATDRRSASKCQGKWPDQALNASWTAWSIGSWQDLQFCACPQSRKSLTFTSVRDSSGESRSKGFPDAKEISLLIHFDRVTSEWI